MAEEKQFRRIRTHINQGRYDEARVLLMLMGDNPRAQAWLTRLNQVAPPPTTETPAQAQQRTTQQLQTAKKEWDRQVQEQRSRYLALRLAGLLLLVVCQCAWLLPFSVVLNNAAEQGGFSQPAWLQAALRPVESLIGGPLDGISNQLSQQVMSRGAQQVAPMLYDVCERQGLGEQEQALCRQIVDEIGVCLAGGGTPGRCMQASFEGACRQVAGEDPQAYQTCIGEVERLTQALP